MKKIAGKTSKILLGIVFAMLAVCVAFAQAETPVEPGALPAPQNWVAVTLSAVLPLASALLVRYKSVMNNLLTTLLGLLVNIGGVVYGIINVRDLTAVDISLLVVGVAGSLALYIMKDPEKKE
jgi:hypothetical protein